MKKFFSFLVVLVFMSGMLAGLPITAVEEYTSGVLTYMVDGTSVTITGCDDSATDSQLAEAFSDIQAKGYVITTIGKSAINSRDNLTSITLPEGVTSIGDFAFSYCPVLISIEIPNSVISIGNSAFWGLHLTSIIIPDSVTSIGAEAFNQCYSLTSVVIGNSVTSIGESAFCVGSKLTSITIPKSVTDIGKQAFGYYHYDDYWTGLRKRKAENFIIYGYTGTAAETYATENDFTFIALDGKTEPENPNSPEDLEALAKYGLNLEYLDLSNLLGGEIKITIPDEVSLVGGDAITLNLSKAVESTPLSIDLNEEEHKVTVGYNFDVKKSSGFGKLTNSLEKDLKSKMNIKRNSYAADGVNRTKNKFNNRSIDIEPIFNGAIEFKFDEDLKFKSAIGIIYVGAEVQVQIGKTHIIPTPVGVPIPVRFELTATGGAEVQATLGYDFENKEITSNSGAALNVNVGIEVFGGVGCSFANGGFYGQIGVDVDAPIIPDIYLREVTLSGEVGAKVKFLTKEAKWAFISGNIAQFVRENYPAEGEWNFFKSDDDEENNYLAEENFFPIKNNYLSEYIDNINSPNELLIQNAYGYIAPQIVTCGGTTLMVYTDIDSTRDTYNQQRLFYRVLAENTWSAAKPLDTNDTVDNNFSLATDGENIYIAYEESKNILTSDTDLTTSAAQIEITTAVWNGENFTDFTTITDNDIYDYSPQITFVDGEFAVAFISNSSNNIFGNDSNNTLKLYNGFENILIENCNMINSFAVNNGEFAALIDTDNDFLTPETDFYLGGELISTGNYSNIIFSNNRYLLSNDGYLAEFDGSQLTETEIFVSGNFDVDTINGKESINFVSANGENSALFYIENDNNIWTNPVIILESENYIEGHALYSDDNLNVVYLETNADVNENGIDTYSELLVGSVNLAPKMAIIDAYYDGENVNVAVANTGGGTLEQAALQLTDTADNTLYSLDFEVNLESGNYTELVLPTADFEYSADLNYYLNDFEIDMSPIKLKYGSVSIVDLVTVKKILTNQMATDIFYDIDNNGSINIVDFAMIKNDLLKN